MSIRVSLQKVKFIYDNILVTFETLHSMQKHCGKADFIAVKLNMSKVYNRVEWTYSKAFMRKMGFRESCIKLMMVCVCVKTASSLFHPGQY